MPGNLAAEKKTDRTDSKLFKHTLKVFRSLLLPPSGEPRCRGSLSTQWRHLSCPGLIWPVLDVSCAPFPRRKGWGVMFNSAHVLVSSTYPWAMHSISRLSIPHFVGSLPLCPVTCYHRNVCHHRRTGQSPSAHTRNRTSFPCSPPRQNGTSVTWIENIGDVFLVAPRWATSCVCCFVFLKRKPHATPYFFHGQ